MLGSVGPLDGSFDRCRDKLHQLGVVGDDCDLVGVVHDDAVVPLFVEPRWIPSLAILALGFALASLRVWLKAK